MLAVGTAVINLTPTPVKVWAVRELGTADKPVLIGSVLVVALLFAGFAGVVARRRFGLGVALLALKDRHRLTGTTLAAFYTAIYPGNIGQYAERKDGFGLDTDTRRLVRLFGQPALIAAALWAAGIPEH